MAELNRQLQEYLAQSKSGSSTVLELGEDREEPPTNSSWFGRWSSPFRRPQSPGNTAAPAWGLWSEPEPEPWLGGCSRTQRLSAALVLSSLSLLCFSLAALYAPLLLLYARKFSLLWSLGSLFAAGALGVLRGPSSLLSPPALLYLTTLTATLWAALGLRSTVLTASGAIVQVVLILYVVISSIPGGAAGLRFVGAMTAAMFKRAVRGGAMSI